MMGEQKGEQKLFSYAVNLEKRVRSDHPLRRVAALIDFKFVREEVAHCYGSKGNISVDPEVIMKMMFLLFFDDVTSERELMKVIAERLDYLWFLGYGLDDEILDHSVLFKARATLGKDVFESLRGEDWLGLAGVRSKYFDIVSKAFAGPLCLLPRV